MVEEEADSRVEEVFFAPNDADQSMSLFLGNINSSHILV